MVIAADGSGREALAVAIEEVAGVLVVSLTGELDIASARELPTQLLGRAQEVPRGVVVDLAGLSFIDSSGINALVETARAVEARGGAIAFAAETPAVRRVLDIVQLDDVVVRAPDVASAVERIGGATP